MTSRIGAARYLLLASLLLALCLAGGLAGLLARPANAQVTLPVVSISAGQESVVEGDNATFTLTRTGDTSQRLRVLVLTYEPSHPQSNSEDSEENPTRIHHNVTFQAGEDTATLSVAVDLDGVSESDGADSIRAQVDLSFGSGLSLNYAIDPAAQLADIVIDDPPPPTVSIVANQTEVVEGEIASFTLTRTGDASQPLTVRVLTYEPSHPKANPTEFNDNPTLVRHDVTFQAGEDTATLSVAVDFDGVSEPDTSDSIRAQISFNLAGAYLVDPDAGFVSTSITDRHLPTVSIVANQAEVVEGENASFTLTRTGETAGELSVQVYSAEYNGGSFRLIVLEHTVAFEPGSSTAVLTVATDIDGIPEDSDWIAAEVFPGSGYVKGDPGRATITITDLILPDVSIAADQDLVAEGEAATFTLTRTGNTSNALTVNVAVADPGAFLRGNHWKRTPAARITVNFAAGSATALLSLQTVDDWRDIPDNNVSVSVVAGDNYAPGDPTSASVTVTDNDVAPEVEVTLNETSIVEGETLIITVRLHDASRNLLEVGLVAGFRGRMTTQYFSLNEDEPAVEWYIPTEDDDLDEADRVFEATILPFPNESLAHAESEYWTVRGDRSVSATVTDNDLPLVYVRQVEEAYEEGTLGDLRLVRVGDTAHNLDVKYRTSETGHDVFRNHAYLMGREQTWTIPASSSHADVFFTLQWDDGDEDEGAITLEVLPSSRYRIDPDRSVASFRVIDDDPEPVLSVSDTSASVSESDGAVEFTVTLEAEVASRRAVTVEYATADGTADAGEDYTETSGTLTFSPGQTSRTISVPVTDDSLAEYHETFTLTLSNPVNATLLDGVDSITATGTIRDDEPLIRVTRLSREVTEGEPAVFDITRDPNFSRELTVTLMVLERPTGGVLTTELQTVTFPPNIETVRWETATEDNDVDEPDGTVGLAVLTFPRPDHPPAYWSAGNSALFVTILDNDLPTVTIEAAHSDRKEGQDVEFTLTRQGDLSVPLTVNVTVTGGDDYLTGEQPATAVFAAGASSVSLSLPTEDDDPVDDDDMVTVTIADGDGYQAGEPAAASVSLFDSQRFYPSVSIRAKRAGR